MGSWFRRVLPFLREPAAMPLYFMHIPKTAGTTVDFLLRRRFSRWRRNRTFDNVQLMRMSPHKFASLEYISGHLEFGYYLEELIGRPVRTIAFVREPRALLLSIYKQVKKETADPVHDYVKANCPDVESFFNDPAMSEYVANFQTRYIALAERRFDAATIEQVRRARKFEIDEILLEAIEREQLRMPTEAALLAQSLQRLGQCWFVGLTERLDESMSQLAVRLGWPPFPAAPQLNCSPRAGEAERVPNSVLKRIDQLTVLDRMLYEETARMYFGRDIQRAA